jgi:hypothetical protein
MPDVVGGSHAQSRWEVKVPPEVTAAVSWLTPKGVDEFTNRGVTDEKLDSAADLAASLSLCLRRHWLPVQVYKARPSSVCMCR